jgi:hypothetical protein
MARRVALGLAVFVGLVWAVMQLVYTSLATSLAEWELDECGVDPSSTSVFKLLSIGVAVAGALAFVLSFRRRPPAVLAALGVETVLALIWFAEGAWKAASCAIE